MGRSGGRSQRAQSWPARSNFIARWQWPAGTGAPRRRARSNGDRGVAAGPAREARLEPAAAAKTTDAPIVKEDERLVPHEMPSERQPLDGTRAGNASTAATRARTTVTS